MFFFSELLQTNLDMKLGEISQNKMSCCWRVLCWFAAFTSRFKKRRRKSADQISESSNTDDSLNTESSSCSSADDSNIAQYQTLYNTAEVVRYVLYSTKENVICLHEVFRQVVNYYVSYFYIVKIVWRHRSVCRHVLNQYIYNILARFAGTFDLIYDTTH